MTLRLPLPGMLMTDHCCTLHADGSCHLSSHRAKGA
jgi:hypothetical protein